MIIGFLDFKNLDFRNESRIVKKFIILKFYRANTILLLLGNSKINLKTIYGGDNSDWQRQGKRSTNTRHLWSG